MKTTRTRSAISAPKSVAAVLAAAATMTVAGCSTLPHDTDPQVLRSYEPRVDEAPAVGPRDGREPDLLLRDFYTATAIPTGDFAAARAYMTAEAAEQWSPEGPALLVDAIDIVTAQGSNDENERAFTVRGTVIGSLESGGAYASQNGGYEARISMRRIDGQWRIADLPAGVVLERTELRNQYQPENLYFFEPSGRALISDRRWVYTGKESLGTELITMLMEGPDSQIEPAVDNVVPSGAVFAGVSDGVYTFTGMSRMSENDRTRFAAQLVWTLANAGIPGPYHATADGAPLAEGLEELRTDDFAEFNPRSTSDVSPVLYAVSGGRIMRVGANNVEPLGNVLGTAGNVQSGAVAANGNVAAVVTAPEKKSKLMLGRVDGAVQESIEADTLSRPTFEYGGEAAWVVVDGKHVTRFVRSTASGRIVEARVNTAAMDNIKGEISVLRLGPSGVRVAMIIGGHVYTGIVLQDEAGTYSIVNVRETAVELGGTALTLDWQPDGSIVVGTSTPETPVWRVEQDGSSVATLPAGNITAPVVSVAANATTIYATDAHAMLQLSPQESDSSYWREVPGLQGVRSAPIVAQ